MLQRELSRTESVHHYPDYGYIFAARLRRRAQGRCSPFPYRTSPEVVPKHIVHRTHRCDPIPRVQWSLWLVPRTNHRPGWPFPLCGLRTTWKAILTHFRHSGHLARTSEVDCLFRLYCALTIVTHPPSKVVAFSLFRKVGPTTGLWVPFWLLHTGFYLSLLSTSETGPCLHPRLDCYWALVDEFLLSIERVGFGLPHFFLEIYSSQWFVSWILHLGVSWRSWQSERRNERGSREHTILSGSCPLSYLEEGDPK